MRPREHLLVADDEAAHVAVRADRDHLTVAGQEPGVALPYAGVASWTLAFQTAGAATSTGLPIVITTAPLTVTLLP